MLLKKTIFCTFFFCFIFSINACADLIHDSSLMLESKNSFLGMKFPRLGLETFDKDIVPMPWEVVVYSAAKQSSVVWNRTYSFSSGSLLSSAKCGGVELLTEPVSLAVKVNGKSGQLSFAEPVVVKEKTGKGRLVLERRGHFSSVQANLTYTVEYDGLIWCELRLVTPGGERLEKLQLHLMLNKESAELIHYVGAPLVYASQNDPKYSFSKQLSLSPGICHQSGLKTMVWVGNTKQGILWCTESDQFWWPKDQEDCIQLKRQEDGRNEFTVNMVSDKMLEGTPRSMTFSFGLMATPVKPRPEGWREWTFSTQWDSNTGYRRGSNLIYWPDEYRYMQLDHDPSRYVNVGKVRKKVARDVREGRKILPYLSRLNINKESVEPNPGNHAQKSRRIRPDSEYMIKKWGIQPNLSSKMPNMPYRLSTQTNWADYLVWCVEGFAGKMGHADGIYLDEVQPVPNVRAESGGGYDAIDGSRRPTFEFFGTRNLLKRIAYNTYKRNQTCPRIVAHCSATQTVNSLSACDTFLVGEQYNINYLESYPNFRPPSLKPKEKFYYYSYALPMDRMRTECFGRQWGEVILWLPQLKGQPKDVMNSPITTRDMLSRVMQADVLVWPIWCNQGEVYKTWRFRREFDIGDPDVKFIPYWENDIVTAIPIGYNSQVQLSPEVVIGYYANETKNTYLMIVSNLSRTSQKVEIDFGVLPIISITDAETYTKISKNKNGCLMLDLNRNDYRALRINY